MTDGESRAAELSGRHVDDLSMEAEGIADRLAEFGSTAPLEQLMDLSGRYARVQGALAEEQAAWLQIVRGRMRSFLD